MMLSSRITIALIAVSVLTAITGGVLTHLTLASRLHPLMLDQMVIRTDLACNAVDAIIQGARTDVQIILGYPSLRALAELGDATSAPPERPEETGQLLRRLESGFASQMNAEPDYIQMRVIGLDRGGREILRVDRSGEAGAVRVVPEQELQVKGDRPYFLDTIALGRGQIYLGRVELNREHGEIEQPHVPVLRIAAPIHTERGEPYGIVIINVDMRKAFALVRTLSKSVEATYVVNRQGDYLLHPDESKVFGFDLGSRHRLQDDFPKVPDLASLPHSEARLIQDRDGRRVAISLAPLPPIGSDIAIIVQTKYYDDLMQSLSAVQTSTVVAGVASLLVALLAAAALSRSAARPLRAVMKQLDDFRQGAAMSPIQRGPTEIVLLSAALDQMAGELLSRTNALEEEVAVRRETERALNAYVDKVQLFTAVVESSDDAIVSMGLDGIITSWNLAAEHLYGYVAIEAIGKSIEMVIPSDRTGENRRLMEHIATGKRVAPFQTLRRHKDGHTLDVSLTISPIILESGRITGASAIARDISRRLLAEEKFRLVVESSPNGIVMVDGAGTVQLVNRETERLFGYRREELLGKSMEVLVPARFRAHHPRLRQEFIAEPTGRSMGEGRDLFGQHKDGTEFPIEVGLNPIQTREGMMVLSVIVDITERKRSEAEIRRYTEELMRSNRELETFAYAASHDLQEPLRMVASYVELLAQRYRGKLDDKADKYIYYAVDGATRMKQLINDLLAYSRVSTQGKPLEPTDAAAVLGQVMRTLEGFVREAGAEVTWSELPMVMADSIQLGQVFQNLISNGVKFRGAEPPRVHIEAVPADDYWEFQVHDNGIGIDPKFGERVFQMFQRLNTREEYSGTGIGLAIAQKIVERHGGRIWFTSPSGTGTTFHFTICRI